MRHLMSMNKACSPLREPDAVLLTGFDVLVFVVSGDNVSAS